MIVPNKNRMEWMTTMFWTLSFSLLVVGEWRARASASAVVFRRENQSDGGAVRSPNRSAAADSDGACKAQAVPQGHPGHARHPRRLHPPLPPVLLRPPFPLRHRLHLRFPFRHCFPVPFSLFSLNRISTIKLIPNL